MKRFFLVIIVGIIIVLGATFFFLSPRTAGISLRPQIQEPISEIPEEVIPLEPPKPVVTHLPVPIPLKAVYMSSWVAGSPEPRSRVMKLVDSTEVNALVIDIKDATGRVSFLTNNETIAVTGSPEARIRNIIPFIQELHDKNIYVIGRISTFQDMYLAKTKPEWALTKKSDGLVWKDRKGLSFLDPANPEVTEYLIELARASYEVGFDEINFDYIRYPSDGNIKDIDYRLPEGKTRADMMEDFYQKLYSALKQQEPVITISADLFGLTTTEVTDMGIGQIFERALPYFDYIAPMVYPSHYADFAGFSKPALHPYEVVKKAMEDGIAKIEALKINPQTPLDVVARLDKKQLRPWLQDFSINGVIYTPEMVRAQITATYDAGLDSWMIWDPMNKYSTSAYLPE